MPGPKPKASKPAKGMNSDLAKVQTNKSKMGVKNSLADDFSANEGALKAAQHNKVSSSTLYQSKN